MFHVKHLGVLENPARFQPEQDERNHGKYEHPADHIAAFVPFASLLDELLRHLAAAFHDHRARLLGWQGHCFRGRPSAVALEYLLDTLLAKIDFGADSLHQALRNVICKRVEGLLVLRREAEDGSFAPIFARLRAVGESNEREQRLDLPIASMKHAEPSRRVRIEESDAVAETVYHPGYRCSLFCDEFHVEKVADKVVGSKQYCSVFFGRRIETCVKSSVGGLHGIPSSGSGAESSVP